VLNAWRRYFGGSSGIKLENARALITSPKKGMCTRSKGGVEATDPEMLLRMAMEKLRQLKEERVLQQQRQKEFATMLQSRDEELRNLRERILQLSHSNNISTTNDLLSGTMRSGLGYKLKPDVFNGDVPLREFLFQFEFIASTNDWSDSVKTGSHDVFAGKGAFRFR